MRMRIRIRTNNKKEKRKLTCTVLYIYIYIYTPSEGVNKSGLKVNFFSQSESLFEKWLKI